MPNAYFQFKKFRVEQLNTAMKVTTDSCLFGAWVADRYQSWKVSANVMLDIGTGTGLLALMMAQCDNRLKIEAIEIDAGAAAEARKNVTQSPFVAQISVFQNNINEYSTKSLYDLIISNPPFYESQLKSGKSEKDIAYHSDELTLHSLFGELRNRLSTTGLFFLLLPFRRKEDCIREFTNSGFAIVEMSAVRASSRHPVTRIMIAGKFGLMSARYAQTEIQICEADGSYSPAFVRLLKDYYLQL